MAPQDSPPKTPRFFAAVTRRDLLQRVRYGPEFQYVYVLAVSLSVVLLLAALICDATVHYSGWYVVSEALLMGFFILEVLVHMLLTGPVRYFSQGKENLFEFSLCAACCTTFGLTVNRTAVRVEIESLLLVVRYSTQLARLYYFLKSHRAQQQSGLGQARVEIHVHDNPTISLRGTPSAELPSTPRGSPTTYRAAQSVMTSESVWTNYEDEESSAIDTFLSHQQQQQPKDIL
eukprot:Rhum_TRINITY_DN21187_c0_g1::Rhum_TRINITY_DN21187_c0_g1_i1::g.173389::m.173389